MFLLILHRNGERDGDEMAADDQDDEMGGGNGAGEIVIPGKATTGPSPQALFTPPPRVINRTAPMGVTR